MTAIAPPIARRSWFRFSHWLHRWTSLIATPFFLVLCITGSVLIFSDEIDLALGVAPTPRQPAASESERSLEALGAAALAQNRNLRLMSIFLDPDRPTQADVGMAALGANRLEESATVYVDRFNAKPTPFQDTSHSFTAVLLKLHSQWFLGVVGELLGSLLAVLVAVALVSGVAIHAPYVRRTAFGVVRVGRGAVLPQIDLHNLIGLVVMGWTFTVAATGTCLGAGSVLTRAWQRSEFETLIGDERLPAAGPSVSIDVAAAAARARQPDRRLALAIFPGTDFSGPDHFTFLMYGTHSYDTYLFDIILVDRRSGVVSTIAKLPWYLEIVTLAGPLHFGNYGGVALKFLWLLSAWGALFITANGAWLWWARRKSRIA